MYTPLPSYSGEDVDYDALAAHGPTNIFLSFILAGVVIAAGILLITRGEIPGLPAGSFGSSGKHAVGAGIVMIGLGIILHFRIFWQHRRPDMWYTTLGVLTGLLTLIGGAAVIMLRFVRII